VHCAADGDGGVEGNKVLVASSLAVSILTSAKMSVRAGGV